LSSPECGLIRENPHSGECGYSNSLFTKNRGLGTILNDD
jgi:hypothetical protein